MFRLRNKKIIFLLQKAFFYIFQFPFKFYNKKFQITYLQISVWISLFLEMAVYF